MGSILNLMAFVVFATTLFMRSVDPVIPQIAQGLDVAPTTAALLSTGFTLPYALIQPLLGAIADMMSKTRLIVLSMLTLGLSTLACGFATHFEILFALRIVAGIAAGGIFPIALAVTGDHVPVGQRQVAIGKILFAAMTGNLLGASGAGVIGDLMGWRGVFIVTALVDLLALLVAIPGFRQMKEQPGRFDLSMLVPNYQAIFRNPLAKYCFGAVFVEAISLFGLFPYMAVLLAREGEPQASIAGIVLAGFGIGGVLYTFAVSRLLTWFREGQLMATGGMTMGLCLLLVALRLPWPAEFANFVVLGFSFYLLHGCVQVYVTELAPTARASATSGHTFFFFTGQALGPVIYGLGIGSVGITPVLIAGTALLSVTGWVCALRLRRPALPAT